MPSTSRQLRRQHAALQRLREAALADALDHPDEELRRAVVVAEDADALSSAQIVSPSGAT